MHQLTSHNELVDNCRVGETHEQVSTFVTVFVIDSAFERFQVGDGGCAKAWVAVKTEQTAEKNFRQGLEMGESGEDEGGRDEDS